MNGSSWIKYLFLLWVFLGLALPIAAQEDCTNAPSRKVQRILDKIYGNQKLHPREIETLFKQALAMDDQCLECRMGLARIQYQIATDYRQNPTAAKQNFEKVIAQCPTYHADVFYYAGLISYANQEYDDALRYFEGFLTFDKTKGKSSSDHDLKEKDVATVLPEIRFYTDFYANPVPFNPKRLEGVNTPGDEYLPMLSHDNEFLFFTRKETVQHKGDLYPRDVENFMQAQATADGKDFQDAKPLPPPFNVGDNYGGVSLSLDNREMFVTVCKPVSASYKNCDIYVTRYDFVKDEKGNTSYKWSGLENLGPHVNTEGWEAQPTLSADGNTLYFATVRDECIKDENGNPTMDIFYSKRDANGAWSPAKPIGGDINTTGHDKSPFLHADSRTLYFSSNGRPGAGGYDIYYSKQDSNGQWSKPKNMGYPINSTQDEHGLVVSTDGKRALFASSNLKSAKGLDMFSFEVPASARPEKVLVLKGDVKNEKGELVPDARIQLKYTKSKEIHEVDVNKQDGSYAAVINLHKNEDVVVSVKSDTENIAFNTRVYTLADTAQAVQNVAMEVEKVAAGKTYKINDIRFRTASSELNEESKRVLEEFAVYLNENKSLQIEIGGHTDNIGDPEMNMVLSTDRAFEVFGFLQSNGVDGRRMKFKGYGQTKPAVPNTSDKNRAQNRRTEFKITKL